MGLFRLSPNEIIRIRNEETNRLKKERIKQVREQAKAYSMQLRKNVLDEKRRLRQSAEVEMKKNWEEEHSREVKQAEINFRNTIAEIGEGHRNAAEIDINLLNEQKALREAENQVAASKRQKEALVILKNEKELKESKDIQHFVDRASALDMEKTRAAIIASLPKKKAEPEPQASPKKPKTYLRKKDVPNVIVEKENINSNSQLLSAIEEAMVFEEFTETLEEKKQRIIKERREKALSRHNEALNREHLKKESEKMTKDIIGCRSEEITARKVDVEKFAKHVLVSNLKQKEKTKKEETTTELLDCSETKESCSINLEPSESSHSSAISSSILNGYLSDRVSSCGLTEASRDTEKCPSVNENVPAHQPQSITLGFELDEHSRKRLQELVLRQQQMAKKRDASLQVNIVPPSSLPDAKHQEVQVISEELKSQKGENTALENHNIDHIRKKKEEIINELMAIEAMRSMLETPAIKVDSKSESQSKTIQRVSDIKRQTEAKISLDDIQIDNVQSDYESFSSSHSSTQYLSFPSDGSILKNSTHLESESILGLCDQKAKAISHHMMTSSQVSHSQSPNYSGSTTYLDVPGYNPHGSLDLSSDSSLQSSFKELPPLLYRFSESSITVSNSQAKIKSIKNSIKGQRKGQVSVHSSINSRSGNNTSPDENSFDSCTLPKVSDDGHKWSTSDQDSVLVSSRVEFIDQTGSMLFKNNSTLDVLSERASAVYFDLENPETESTTLSSGRENLSSSTLHNKISELLHPYNIVQLSRRSSTLLSHSDLTLFSDLSRQTFQDIDNTLTSSAADSCIDIVSERALHFSVELSDGETKSLRSTLGQEHFSENDLSSQTFHDDHSHIKGQMGSDDMSGDSTLLYSHNHRNKYDSNTESNKCVNRVTRNWLNILQPYKDNSETLSNVVDQKEESGNKLDHPLSFEVENGILEEPDLTLVSCSNTTTSLAGNSLHNSGLQPSSLPSIENQEINFCLQPLEQLTKFASVEIKSLPTNHGRINDTRKQKERTSKESGEKKVMCAPSKGKLMYPKENEVHNIFKKTISSWKNSRASVQHDSGSSSSK